MFIAPVILHTSSLASIQAWLSERLLDAFKSAVIAIEDPYLYRTVGVGRHLYSTSSDPEPNFVGGPRVPKTPVFTVHVVCDGTKLDPP
jgi:hypothetical protein